MLQDQSQERADGRGVFKFSLDDLAHKNTNVIRSWRQPLQGRSSSLSSRRTVFPRVGFGFRGSALFNLPAQQQLRFLSGPAATSLKALPVLRHVGLAAGNLDRD